MSNEPTIAEKNRTIAIFIGLVPQAFLNFHESWDSLMPVIITAKALYLRYNAGPVRNQLKVRYKAIENELCNLSLINTHYCLFRFIQWYTNQSTTTNE